LPPTIKRSIEAALKSPWTLVLLAYGAIALFNQWRDWFSDPLAPQIVWLIDLYRRSIELVVEIPTQLVGLKIPWFWQDVLVLWIAVGRITSRTYALINADTQNLGVKYEPFSRIPFRWLLSMTAACTQCIPSQLRFLATIPAGVVATAIWPWILPVFIQNPSVTKEERWYGPFEGGTPHPIQPHFGRRELELPATGKEYTHKFAGEHSADTPRHDTTAILVTYAVVQVGFAATLIFLNSLVTSRAENDGASPMAESESELVRPNPSMHLTRNSGRSPLLRAGELKR
jgi:hypothetical protein